MDKRQTAIVEMLNPVKESLHKLDQGMRQIEKERKGDQESLKMQIQSLFENEKLLKQETSNLVKALRTPLDPGQVGRNPIKARCGTRWDAQPLRLFRAATRD